MQGWSASACMTRGGNGSFNRETLLLQQDFDILAVCTPHRPNAEPMYQFKVDSHCCHLRTNVPSLGPHQLSAFAVQQASMHTLTPTHHTRSSGPSPSAVPANPAVAPRTSLPTVTCIHTPHRCLHHKGHHANHSSHRWK